METQKLNILKANRRILKEFAVGVFKKFAENQIFNSLGIVGYVIQIEHEGRKWKVFKRRKEFGNLHDAIVSELRRKEKRLCISMPDYKEEEGETEESMMDSLRSHGNYLKAVANHVDACKGIAFLSFCEVSNLTFNIKNCIMFKEGILKKRSGGRYKQEKKSFLTYGGKCRRVWRFRWFVLTDQYLAYMRDSESREPIEIMFIDSGFSILYGKRDTGNEKGIIVQNNNRKLRIKARDFFEWRAWLVAFNKAIKKSVWGPYSQRKFMSFAPQRQNNYVKHFIDGKNYFLTLYAELNKAEREIFITDWWFTPEVYLKRPVNIDNEEEMIKYRLDKVLLSGAEKGIKIFVLLWKEVELVGLYNASLHAKNTLTKSHPNIKVIRHPRTLISMWSHHEKIVVIDQKIAFLGGLDLGLGRWDTKKHLLLDPPDEEGRGFFPGLDFVNSRVDDFKNVKNYTKASIDRNLAPRMPWHDVHAVIYGASAQDLARHFIEYWNHAKIDYEGTKNKKEGAFLKPMNTETSSNEGGSFKTKKKFDNESESSDSDFETNYEDSLQQQQSALQPIDEEEESEMMYDINREIAKNELHEGSIAEDKNEDEEDKNEDGDNEEDKNEQNGHYDTKSKEDNHTNQDSESDESDYLEEEDDKVIDVENGNDLADIKILASK